MNIPVGVDLLPSIIKCPNVWIRELGQWFVRIDSLQCKRLTERDSKGQQYLSWALKSQTDKQWSTKHYIETKRLSNMNTKPRGGVLCTGRFTGEGQCVQTDSQSKMNTKPRGGVVCTDRLTEQHEHQTQQRGSVYRLTRQHEHQSQGRGIVQTDSLSWSEKLP